MKLYRTSTGNVIEHEGSYYSVPESSWDALIIHDDLHGYLLSIARSGQRLSDFSNTSLRAPIGSQEVWAAGVTYYRSRDARMAEAKDAGGGDFYDRVYSAERPELFFKATASRVADPGSHVRIRSDATWSVPEPELTLVISPHGKIIGYTIGNDMSSRDIEGENPLYLPQAKVYDRSSALGPCILVSGDPLPSTTPIRLEIERAGKVGFSGATTLAELKRKPTVLVEYLFRENNFPAGAYLMTGTGIVPPDSFTLASGDRVRITIDPIGTLENVVIQGKLPNAS
ncbi:MAG TPA: fumarylacetoacetate hydrolase family protein [Terracidiphilus sp.]|nr:fumarylacetoacetate hydrolase family protein [Terracidiphilus sp.]